MNLSNIMTHNEMHWDKLCNLLSIKFLLTLSLDMLDLYGEEMQSKFNLR